MSLRPITDKQRATFWAKVDMDGPEMREGLGPCWLWTGGRTAQGYGSAYLGGKSITAHRAAAILTGRDVTGVHVCHACDNRLCVNPAHLWTGTAQENNADMKAKGRVARGERSGVSKFTEEQIAEIRALRGVIPQAEIALQFGVTKGAISHVQTGRRWGHSVGRVVS